MGIISSKNLVNEGIQNSKVMVVGSNGLSGVMELKEGLSMADEVGLDLVEVSEKDGISICKLMSYSKFLYEQKKKEKGNQSKKEVVKEIKFGPQIAIRDLEIKAKAALKNLEGGCKVKVMVVYKGRELARIAEGKSLLEKFISVLPENIIVVRTPIIDGKNYIMELKQGK